ncbi:TetR family transcriptional regulator [Mangrovactinospora gilvigrisea]|uniref:TetR family transcriptional regulator n=1 Tax=Mangrovactinospora gilvigrisea TaxID=1428644 RepID=A0A1J7BAU4_9ACTN|nr:TetR/AcrR family transcriptional regulator [Mangrovactinospora gilvigrisea]OIV35815.1 TetR family transcriptional regulator [Mangrovactinospora gilvigrisea]
MTTGQQRARRAPAGAAVLREDVTEAIRAATFQELAAVGYGRLSIEAVARRAGVGKTAVYRRWKSKLPMVIDAVSEIARMGMPVPDTGSLTGDLRLLLGFLNWALRHKLASQIIPDLLAEAARNPEIAATLATALREAQRGISAVVLKHARERGELAGDLDADAALDLVIGPLYWRVAVVRTPLPEGHLDRLASASAAALAALSGGPPPSD